MGFNSAFKGLITHRGMEQVKVLFLRGTIKTAAGCVCIHLQHSVNVGRFVEKQSQWPTKIRYDMIYLTAIG